VTIAVKKNSMSSSSCGHGPRGWDTIFSSMKMSISWRRVRAGPEITAANPARRHPPGREVPGDNVETIVNVARAVDGQPVTHKYVSIVGGPQSLTTVLPVGISRRIASRWPADARPTDRGLTGGR
jgi:hypothetical protein